MAAGRTSGGDTNEAWGMTQVRAEIAQGAVPSCSARVLQRPMGKL